jgi:hypothetical protein
MLTLGAILIINSLNFLRLRWRFKEKKQAYSNLGLVLKHFRFE